MWKKSIQSPCIHQFFCRCNKVVVLVIKLLTSSESRGSFFTLIVEWLISGKWSIRWVFLFNKGLFLFFLFSLLFSFSHWLLCILWLSEWHSLAVSSTPFPDTLHHLLHSPDEKGDTILHSPWVNEHKPQSPIGLMTSVWFFGMFTFAGQASSLLTEMMWLNYCSWQDHKFHLASLTLRSA